MFVDLVWQGTKETFFLQFKCCNLIICMVKVFEIFTIQSFISLVQDPMVGNEKKLNIILAYCIKNDSFEVVFCKKLSNNLRQTTTRLLYYKIICIRSKFVIL